MSEQERHGERADAGQAEEAIQEPASEDVEAHRHGEGEVSRDDPGRDDPGRDDPGRDDPGRDSDT